MGEPTKETIIDFDADGIVVGIEILNASKNLSQPWVGKYGVA